MSTVLYQIPRNSLVWLLVAQTALILPHLPRLPVWVIGCWFVTVLWRVQVFRGHWSFPGRWVKVVVVVVSMGGLLAQYGRFFGLEPMVGLLITAFLLKLLEMQRKRDALIVIYLGYFVAATEFLFSQTIFMSVYMSVAVVLLTTALIGVYQEEGHRYPWRSLTLAAKLLGQSVPLMLVLFLIVPRFGSLWAVPQQTHGAKTGVSDSMSPGDFSNLARSGGTAFRVTFDGPIPPPQYLYWRGLVFSEFDGRRWSQSRYNDYRRGTPVVWGDRVDRPWRDHIEDRDRPVSYDVIMEPTHQPWLYALPTPLVDNQAIGYVRDYRLLYRRPVRNRLRYQVTSHLEFAADRNGLSPWVLERELDLPGGFNPRSRETAVEWYAQAGDAEAYINRVLAFFNARFSYTLQPPLLGRDTVDEFLFQSQRGFCEHFAGSFVFMMRAAGIPARVVVGYQGGTINPLEGYLVVRQADAHAWAEVWLENRGWVRIDPTAAVAPDRIELGLSGALSEEDADLLDDPLAASGINNVFGFIARLRLQLDVWEYNWYRWVMGYDQETQAGVLSRWLGKVSAGRIAVVLLSVGGIVLGIVGLSLAWSGRGKSVDPGDKLYQRFLARLKRYGVERQTQEGPRTLARRVGRCRPEIRPWVDRVTRAYECYAYQGERRALKLLRHAVNARPE